MTILVGTDEVEVNVISGLYGYEVEQIVKRVCDSSEYKQLARKAVCSVQNYPFYPWKNKPFSVNIKSHKRGLTTMIIHALYCDNIHTSAVMQYDASDDEVIKIYYEASNLDA